MAYAKLLLKNNSDTSSEVIAPIGFSWLILFAPTFVNIIILLIYITVATFLGVIGWTGLGQIPLLGAVAILLLYLMVLVLLLLAFSVVPLANKDYKWAVIMVVTGIVSLGLSVWVFAFLYNKIFISEKYKSGYRLDKIMTIDNKELTLAELNPIKYSKAYKAFFVWVNWYEIKFRRYFSNNNLALSFVKNNPEKCLEITAIVKAVHALSVLDISLKDKYRLPFSAWTETNLIDVN